MLSNKFLFKLFLLSICLFGRSVCAKTERRVCNTVGGCKAVGDRRWFVQVFVYYNEPVPEPTTETLQTTDDPRDAYKRIKDGRCGGTIISEYSVLTAAHCIHGDFHGKSKSLGVKVVYGDFSNDKAPKQEFGVLFKEGVAGVVIHPDWDALQQQRVAEGLAADVANDLAIINFKNPKFHKKHVLSLCTSTNHDQLRTIGWSKGGLSRTHAVHFFNLQESAVRELTRPTPDYCGQGFRPNSQICLPGSATHTGDSGGAIYSAETIGVKFPTEYKAKCLYGVISGDRTTRLSATVTIGTRVQFYLRWIKQSMRTK